jgi:hypothetical protein
LKLGQIRRGGNDPDPVTLQAGLPAHSQQTILVDITINRSFIFGHSN